MLSAIASVNQAVDAGNTELTVEALLNPDSRISGIDYNCKDKYLKKLMKAKASKVGVSLKTTPSLPYIKIHFILSLYVLCNVCYFVICRGRVIC